MPSHDVGRAIETGDHADLQSGKMANLIADLRDHAEGSPVDARVLEGGSDQRNRRQHCIETKEAIQLRFISQIDVANEHRRNG